MVDKDLAFKGIDSGKSFNWGKTSKDYAKYNPLKRQEDSLYIADDFECEFADVENTIQEVLYNG